MPFAPVTQEALDRYRRSASRAQFADIMGKVTGANTNLFSYDAVARRLRARQQIEMGTRTVPLDLIVGSVGRYRDFTRTFLPRSAVNPERWARVDAVLNSLEGYPPIELYKIGEVYFVRDGNHRISVARANGLNHIDAYVTEIETDVPLTLDDFERDQWIIKIERAEFEQATQLDVLRPGNQVRLTEPGRYRILLRHIHVHHYFRNLDLANVGDPYRLNGEEAVTSWYDNIYLPVVGAIRSHQLLDSFPSRTEADLYLWIAYHREELARQYNLAPLSPEAAVNTFAETHGEGLVQQAIKSLRLNIYRAFGDTEIPMGMSEVEFEEARARHDAGERTIAEAEEADKAAEAAALHAEHNGDGSGSPQAAEAAAGPHHLGEPLVGYVDVVQP